MHLHQQKRDRTFRKHSTKNKLLKTLQNSLETLKQEGFLIKLDLEACNFINKVNPDGCRNISEYLFKKSHSVGLLLENCVLRSLQRFNPYGSERIIVE